MLVAFASWWMKNMTLFEYMSVAMSLILALTFAEGLRGLHCALQADRRYGVHAAWLFLKLSNPIVYWWSTWGLRDIQEYWNFATYSISLIMPSIMYLQVLSLVSHAPHKISDWREHFFKQRRWFFGLNIVLGVFVVLIWSNALNAAPPRLVPMLAYTFLTVLSVVGFASDNPKLHAVIVSTIGGFTIFYYGVATFRPITF